MGKTKFNKFLQLLTFILLIASIVFWILTFIGWVTTSPKLENLNLLYEAIVSSLGTLFGILGDKLGQSPSKILAERQERQNKVRLLNKVKHIWSKKYFDTIDSNFKYIDINLRKKSIGVSKHSQLNNINGNEITQLYNTGTDIVDIFDNEGGEVLILGEAGAGKTTYLVELARALINRAEVSDDYPIPIIFNLASWGKNTLSLIDWMASELNTIYQVPLDMSKTIVENDQVLPLLDGLDEVKIEYKERCVEAINQYHKEHGLVSIAVSSRTSDYERHYTQLFFQEAIELLPLSENQIKGYLQGSNLETKAARQTLNLDPDLMELAKTPFFLNIMVDVYQAMDLKSLSNLDSTEKRRKLLLNTYINHRISKLEKELDINAKKLLEWLAWLAKALDKLKQNIFFIDNLQPILLTGKMFRWLYLLSSRIIGALCLSLCIAVGYGRGNLNWWLIGIFGGLIVSLVDGIKYSQQEYNKSKVFTHFPLIGTIVGILIIATELLDLIYGIQLHQSSIFYQEPNYHLMYLFAGEFQSWLRHTLIFATILGIAFEIVFGKKYPKMDYDTDIHTTDILTISWRGALQGILSGLLMAAGILLLNTITNSSPNISGLVTVGFLWVFIGTIVLGLQSRNILPESKEPVTRGITITLRNALISALYTAILIAPLTIVIISKPLFNLVQSPNFQNITLFSKPIAFYYLSPAYILTMFLICIWNTSGYSFGVGLRYGFFDIIKHYVLRLMLLAKGYIPKNYLRFLDHAVKLNILKRVGGGYIFAHRLIQDYFISIE